MKKSIYVQFLEFKGRHNLSTSQIREIAEDYANSGPDFARSYFSKKYEISKHVFYRARDFAVICMLVDTRTQERIFEKAKFNSKQHNIKKSAAKSIAHSAYLMKKRAEFFNSFTQNDIEDICRKYAEGVELSKIAHAYDTGISAVKFLLKKGLLLGYVDEPTYAAIRLRVKLSGKDINVIFK